MIYRVSNITFSRDLKQLRNVLVGSQREFLDRLNDEEFSIGINTLVNYERGSKKVKEIKQKKLVNQIIKKFKEDLELLELEIEYVIEFENVENKDWK